MGGTKVQKRKRADEMVETPAPAVEEKETKTVQQAGAQLFVRRLPPQATSEELSAFFADIGPIRTCFVVGEQQSEAQKEGGAAGQTPKNKGYGFVTLYLDKTFLLSFGTPPSHASPDSAVAEDATTAMKELASKPFQGRKLFMEIAKHRQRKDALPQQSEEAEEATETAVPAKRPRYERSKAAVPVMKGKAKLIVRNLSFHCEEKDLRTLFSKMGKVTSVHIPLKTDDATATKEGKNANQKKRGFAFIEFAEMADAEKAIAQLNLTSLKGRPIAVDWALAKKQWEKSDTAKALKEEAQIKEEEESTSEAEEEESKEETSGESDGEEETTSDFGRTVFIRNLSFTTSPEELRSLFVQFGPIQYAVTTKDETGAPKGTGFVCFKHKADTDACLDAAARDESAALDAKKQQAMQSGGQMPFIVADKSEGLWLDDRPLFVMRAVDRSRASQLKEADTEESRKRDRRHLYLLRESFIRSDSKQAQATPPKELEMRQASYAQRKKSLAKNLALYVSKTRLSIRNLPKRVDQKELKQVCTNAVKQWKASVATAQQEGRFGKSETEEYKYLLREEGLNELITLKQVKVMYEPSELIRVKAIREATKASKKTDGEKEEKSKEEEQDVKPKNKGFAFVEFAHHAHALACQRVLDNNPSIFPAKGNKKEVIDSEEKAPLIAKEGNGRRLLVEFAIEDKSKLAKRDQRLRGGDQKAALARIERKTGNGAGRKGGAFKSKESGFSQKQQYEQHRANKSATKPSDEAKAERPSTKGTGYMGRSRAKKRRQQ